MELKIFKVNYVDNPGQPECSIIIAETIIDAFELAKKYYEEYNEFGYEETLSLMQVKEERPSFPNSCCIKEIKIERGIVYTGHYCY